MEVEKKETTPANAPVFDDEDMDISEVCNVPLPSEKKYGSFAVLSYV